MKILTTLIPSILFLQIISAVSPLQAAPTASQGLYFSIGSSSGTHNSHLEKKDQGDYLSTAFLNSGQGYASDWQNKDASSLPLTLEYRGSRLLLLMEQNVYFGLPSYQRVISVSGITLADHVDLESLQRGSLDNLIGWNLLTATKVASLHILGGVRSLGLAATYDTKRLANIGGVNLIGISLDTETTAATTGLIGGLRFRLLSIYGMALELRALVFSGNGDWELRQRYLLFGNATAFSFRNEDGDYRIFGNQIRLRLESPLSRNWTLYMSYTVEHVRHTNSNVLIITENISSNTSTYLLDAVLSYGGSSYRESLSTLEVGFQYHFRSLFRRPAPIKAEPGTEI